jgi:glycosyltransferase involved in cell wall biosynthesis
MLRGSHRGNNLLSIVIPIHNEERLLAGLISGICAGLARFNGDYEIILCENGSSDQTLPLAREIAANNPQVTVLTTNTASYGAAIRRGILHCKGDRIVVFNADLWDMKFLYAAYDLLNRYDIVIASKRHPDSNDQRPLNRRLITWGFNFILRVLFGFDGTDTHGMKAFRRVTITPVVRRSITDREIFDTEVILRARQAGLTLTELPTVVEETRPSRYSTFARVPRTFKDLWILYKDLHFSPQSKLDEA